MKLRTFNNILSLIIIILVGKVLLAPVIANVMLWWEQRTDAHHGYVYKSATVEAKANQQLKAIPQDNRIVIPSIQLDSEIFEGASPKTLLKGPWRRPATSDPTQGGNTVVAAHRINYGGVGDFYNLDKVKMGDTLIVYWQHKEYDYKVDHIETVSPLDTTVEENTPTPVLTLYTCTPLLTFTHRLIVRGSLTEGGS